MAEKVNLQQKIQAYRQSNPKLKKLSDNQVLSIMVKNGVITLTAKQKQSIFASSKQKDNNTGLQVEKTTKAKPKKTIYLQSGRKVVYSRLADGRTVMQYFGADGTPIKPDYFKKVEGQISIAANGSSYTVTKNGKKRVLKAKNPTQGAVDQNLARLNNEEKRLNKTKKEQGLIGKGWDWVKNKTGIGDGSDKAQQQINAERKLLNQVKTGKISKKDFKNATGVEYTKENLEKFKRGELSQTSTKINGYKEGQEMAADVVGDMVSGIAAVTIYTAAVAAAPFTGGASIAVGVAAATASGALIKAGVKALDTVGTDKKYTMKDFGHDLATGAFSGALAPITGGLGGAVGKTVATKLGIQAVKQVGKEVAEEVVETGVKQGLKTALTNPAGYEYVGGTLLKRGTAMAAEMATDGALGGAIDGGFRAGLDNNWDTEAMLDGAVEGGIGGAIMSPIIGGGFKVAGKGAQKVFGKDNVKVDANGNKVADEVPSKIENETPRVEKDVNIESASSKKSITQEEQEIPTKKAANLETPIQVQQRLIKELENAKSREDFSRITQEMKNLPKTPEYQAVKQRLGGEYFQRYNEWKANQLESTRAIKNMADDVSFKEIKLKENSSLTPQETKSNLLELGFTPEEIANIDCENKGVQTYINVARTMIFELKMEFPGVNLKDPQARKGLIEEALNVDEEFLNTALFKYLNKENVNTLKQYITDLNDFEDYKNLFSNLEYCEYLDLLIEKIPLISKLYNNKLSIEDIKNYDFGYDYKLQNLDENSATKISEYNKLLPEEYQFRLFDIDRLTEENLSLETIKSYAKECERFKEIGLDEYSDSHSTIAEKTEQMRTIADMIKQYKLNFKYKEGGKEYSLGNSTLIDIANSNNIKETVEFLNSLTPEGRALGVRYLKAPTTIPKESFVNFLNKLSKSENISFDRKDEIVKMLYSEDMKKQVDFTDYIIELTENTSVLKDYGWEEYCLVANQDYKGAKNLLNELKTCFKNKKEFDKYINDGFCYICQDKNIDYTRAVANIKEMGNRNLSVDAQSNLNSIIRSSNKEAVDKVELLDKAGFHNSSLVRDLLSENEISLSKINEKLDIVKAEIRRCYPDLKDIDDNLLLQYINLYNYNHEYYLLHAIKNDCKTIDDISAIYGDGSTGISYLRSINETNKQLFKMLMNDNDIPKNDIIRILYATTEANVTFAEKLCADKNFPKDKIVDIIKATNKDNLAFAEKLCADKDFPNDKIAGIVGATNKDNLAFAEKLCADKEFPKDKIANIVRGTNEDNLAFAEKLCADKEFPKDKIAGIVRGTYKYNLAFAEKLCADKDFPKDKIADIVSWTNKDNLAFAEKLCADKDFPKDKIADIVRVTNEDNLAFAEKLCADKDFPKDQIADIVRFTNKDNIDYAINLCTNYKKYGINQKHIAMLIKNKNNVSIEQYQQLLAQFNKEELATWAENDIVIGCQLSGLIGKQNINEIPLSQKRSILKTLVSCNTNLFGITDKLKGKASLIPRNQEEYCELLPALVRSLGIETNKLSAEQITHTNKATQNLSKSLAKLSDSDFAKLSISQEYSREDFINTVLEKTKNLPETERQKVFDYYGFELLKNDTNKTGCTLYGYPVNLNNGHKLAEINDVNTKAVVESLRNDVVRFSKNNRIKCENPQVEQFLNEIVEVLPEIRTMIGKAQHGNNGTRGAHDYDVMKHSLKVMQKISQDPKFAKLNESDKKVMMLASLMHDITKLEGHPDGMHAENGAFDVFFIAKKFNLTPEEETKLYKICKYHEWLNFVNTSKSERELTKRLQSVAFDLQQDNLVDMAEIFTHADLRAVKADDSFHDTKVGKSRVDFNGNVRSFGESADIYVARIKEYQKELQKSQPILPVTKFPQASRMKQAITTVNADGSTNLKGVYQDKDGVVVIKFNEMTDESWEAIGFPKGTSAKGVKAKGLNNSGAETDVETGNIHFFVHGLDYSNQLAKFDAFSLVDSDVLLSVSYAERPESKYRFFRSQGVLLDIPTKYVYGGGNTDSGSGCGKNIQEFKNNYIFGGRRESDRLYISNLVKEATGMSDTEYVQFVKENENKSMLEIEPANIREKIIQKFATINSNVRKGNREYNEMYGSNPQVMGVFAYSQENKVGQPIDFLNNIYGNTHFLKEYAKERDLPFIVFGD